MDTPSSINNLRAFFNGIKIVNELTGFNQKTKPPASNPRCILKTCNLENLKTRNSNLKSSIPSEDLIDEMAVDLAALPKDHEFPIAYTNHGIKTELPDEIKSQEQGELAKEMIMSSIQTLRNKPSRPLYTNPKIFTRRVQKLIDDIDQSRILSEEWLNHQIDKIKPHLIEFKNLVQNIYNKARRFNSTLLQAATT